MRLLWKETGPMKRSTTLFLAVLVTTGSAFGQSAPAFAAPTMLSLMGTPIPGQPWARGFNEIGQLGDNSTTNSLVPVQVSVLTGVTTIAAGEYHNLAIGPATAKATPTATITPTNSPTVTSSPTSTDTPTNTATATSIPTVRSRMLKSARPNSARSRDSENS
jgi:hypothetical protein